MPILIRKDNACVNRVPILPALEEALIMMRNAWVKCTRTSANNSARGGISGGHASLFPAMRISTSQAENFWRVKLSSAKFARSM
jgi:hypothetical protein